MNQFQTDVMNYLASKDSEDRRRAMKLLVDRRFFDPKDHAEDSERKIQLFLNDNLGFCSSGIMRFKQALGLVVEQVTIEIRALVDLQPDSDVARDILTRSQLPQSVRDRIGQTIFGLEGEYVSWGPGKHNRATFENYTVLEMGAQAKAPVKKAVAKKVTATKKAVKRAPAKKVAAKKAPAKKAPVKKAPVRVRG